MHAGNVARRRMQVAGKAVAARGHWREARLKHLMALLLIVRMLLLLVRLLVRNVLLLLLMLLL